jgi:hypothetical protein
MLLAAPFNSARRRLAEASFFKMAGISKRLAGRDWRGKSALMAVHA